MDEDGPFTTRCLNPKGGKCQRVRKWEIFRVYASRDDNHSNCPAGPGGGGGSSIAERRAAGFTFCTRAAANSATTTTTRRMQRPIIRSQLAG